MFNIFQLINQHRTYESYGDILEGKKSFNLTRQEHELYDMQHNADKQRVTENYHPNIIFKPGFNKISGIGKVQQML